MEINVQVRGLPVPKQHTRLGDDPVMELPKMDSPVSELLMHAAEPICFQEVAFGAPLKWIFILAHSGEPVCSPNSELPLLMVQPHVRVELLVITDVFRIHSPPLPAHNGGNGKQRIALRRRL